MIRGMGGGGKDILCEGFTLALQQIVAGLGALELALHQPERLSGWENGLPSLKVVYVLAMRFDAMVRYETNGG